MGTSVRAIQIIPDTLGGRNSKKCHLNFNTKNCNKNFTTQIFMYLEVKRGAERVEKTLSFRLLHNSKRKKSLMKIRMRVRKLSKNVTYFLLGP